MPAYGGGQPITPLTIAGTPGAATVGDSTAFVPAIIGGVPPYRLEQLSGSLPKGRAVSGRALEVAGRYEQAGDCLYVLRASDAAGNIADLPVSENVAAPAGLALSNALRFSTRDAPGTLVATIANVPAGVTPSLSPNDGRMVISGDAASGWTVVVGMTAAAGGKILLAVEASGVIGATAEVTVLDDATTHYIASAAYGYAGVPVRAEYSSPGSLIDVRARLAQSNWQTASGIIGGIWRNGDQRSQFKFYFDRAAGRVGFAYMDASGQAMYQNATVALPTTDFPPDSIRDVRVTRDPVRGVTTFYYSIDRGATWIQLGAAVPGMAGNIFKPAAGALGLVLFQAWGGGEQLVTRMYEFQLRVADKLVANPVFEIQAAGTTSFADAAASGVTWTFGNGAVIV